MQDVVGSTRRSRQVRALAFHCPSEGVTRSGTHLEVRVWTTVLGRRMVPGQHVASLVECDSCGATYQLDAVEVTAITLPSDDDPGAAGAAPTLRTIDLATDEA